MSYTLLCAQAGEREHGGGCFFLIFCHYRKRSVHNLLDIFKGSYNMKRTFQWKMYIPVGYC